MSRGLRIILSIAAVLLAVIALTYLVKGHEIRRLKAANSLFSEDRIVHNFSHIAELFFHEDIDRGDGPITTLHAHPEALPDLSDWTQQRALTALVVLHDGQLVHERYFKDTLADDTRIGWAVSTSILSALTGILVDDGTIQSLEDPVTRYAHSLIGTAYNGSTVDDLLHMSSGVAFNEDYLNPRSDINRWMRSLAWGRSLDRFIERLHRRFFVPGARWHYASTDAQVLAMVLEGASGTSMQNLLSEKLFVPMGIEADPVLITDKKGRPFMSGGLGMRTRDFARFGQMFLQHGRYNGTQIVPASWVEHSTRPSAKTPEDGLGYGYLWWTPQNTPTGEYFARGIYGQYVYVNTTAHVVIAINAVDPKFESPHAFQENLHFFRTISNALSKPTTSQQSSQ